jgi:hypothetical protein
MRPSDLERAAALLSGRSQLDALHDEMREQQHAPLMQSASWFRLWRISDALVVVLEQAHWRRCGVKTRRVQVAAPVAALAAGSGEDPSSPTLRAASRQADDDQQEGTVEDAKDRRGWFGQCESLIALQFAFVLRDVLARIMTSLFTAMLCLTLLTAAHLLYLFQGRSSMLTIDLLAVAGAALLSMAILVAMERDTVLSRLRHTTPGRIDLNWEFAKRIAVYGLLPLLAVIASLFPEIGEPLFGWLEPLRKLTSL